MNLSKKIFAAAICGAFFLNVFSADWYVSLSTGQNKNSGAKDAPFKNVWKALEKAAVGDTIYIAEGNYPGKMKCGWLNMTKPVSLIGGYSADFPNVLR